MPSCVARGLGSLARTVRTLLSQIAVSVATALCVAFITGAYFDRAAEHPAAADALRIQAPAAIASEPPALAAPSSAAALPPLDAEVIGDLPALRPVQGETFPGVPAGIALDALRRAVAEKDEAPRRFPGVALPFT